MWSHSVPAAAALAESERFALEEKCSALVRRVTLSPHDLVTRLHVSRKMDSGRSPHVT